MKITFNLISKEETHGGIQMRHIVCMSTFVALLCGAANIFHVHIVGGNSSCRHWRKFLLARIKSSLFRSGGTRTGARGGGTPGRCCRRIQPGTRRRRRKRIESGWSSLHVVIWSHGKTPSIGGLCVATLSLWANSWRWFWRLRRWRGRDGRSFLWSSTSLHRTEYSQWIETE